MSHPEFSTPEVERGITEALRAGDVAVVPSLLRLMALQDPDRAQYLFNVLQAALDVAEAHRGENGRSPDGTK